MRQVVAVLGVGGGALPVCLHAQLPATHVDAVELSPGVAAAARAHFGLVPDQVNPLATGLASLTCALSEESHLTSLTSLSLSLSLSHAAPALARGGRGGVHKRIRAGPLRRRVDRLR
jgi:hypothetical protein